MPNGELDYVDIRKKVMTLLESTPTGMSTSEIAKKLNVSRTTTSKYLEMIRLTGNIEKRKLGPVTLWFISPKINKIKEYIRSTQGPVIDSILRGDETKIRPTLGDAFPLTFFRTFKIALAMVDSVDNMFYEMGEVIAKEELSKYVDTSDLATMMKSAAPIFEKLRIGLVKVHPINDEHILVDLRECTTCYGMPNIGSAICYFEAGIIGGLVDATIGKSSVKEIKCWGLGDNYCQFDVRLI
jgi:hypothetical protein